MKHLLAFISLLFATLTTQAANPAFQDFFGTNGIVIRTNGNKVQVDGAFLTNGASAVYFTTNLFATNIYVSNIVAQFITVESNLFVNNTITTNLTVVNNSYTSNLFATNIFVNQTLVTSNIFVTNLFAGNTYTTNLFATNITVQNTYVSNIYTTNIFVEQTTVVSNLYATNIFVDNFYSTNIIVTNLTVNNTVTENLYVTTNLTVVNNAYISNIVTEVNQTVINITSNLYVTNIIAGTIISKDILWTNDNGTVRLIDEGRLGLGTNAGDAMFLIEVGTNAINAIKYSTNGLTLFMVKSNGDLSTIRGVAYAWPNVQGGAGAALTNDGSGNLGWSASVGSVTLGMLRTNIFTTNVQGSPVDGVLWLQGTTGSAPTNGARTVLEYVGGRYLRLGAVAGNGQAGIAKVSTSTYSNYWDSTNIGAMSIAFGSNNLVRGDFSAILGGDRNVIETNSNFSFIGSGAQNFIISNIHSSVIVGGTNNQIISSNGAAITKGNFIGGGGDNVIRGAVTQFGTIVGGSGNQIGSINSPQNSSTHSFIGGGLNNSAFGSHLVIGGGEGNSMSSASTTFPTYSVIGGGQNNVMLAVSGTAADGSTISGGRANAMGVAANGAPDDATISGGTANLIDAGQPGVGGQVIGGGAGNFIGFNNYYSVISGGKSNQIQNSLGASFILGGTSNNVTAFGGVIGWWTTNAANESVRIGAFNTNAVGFDRYGLKAEGQARVQAGRSGTYTAIGGTLTNSVGPIVNAGATETNLMTYTVTANVLTNTGDRIIFRASGRFNANGNNKQLKAIWGSETILDTTAQAANSGAWVINGEIIRTGNTAQFASADYNGNGLTLFTTANSKPLVQTNGIATVLKITGTATADGDITNNTFTVEYRPTFPNQ